MKPFKQGVFSRYCSVYSTLNSLQSLGIKLKYQQWQQLYDYLLYGINYFDALYEINACGADHKRLEVIFQYASEWLEKHCKLKLVFQRPFWNKRISLNELVECAKQQIADKKAVHLRIRSSLIDHYTVIKRITAKGAKIVFHKENLTFAPDRQDPYQKMMMTMLGAVAELERNLILERQREGIALAKLHGKYKGGQPKLTAQQVEEIKALITNRTPITQIAKQYGISRRTVYNYL